MTPESLGRKILLVMMRYCYGDESRGLSGDIAQFHDNLVSLGNTVEPFWYDAYFDDLPALQKVLMDRAEILNPDLVLLLPYTDQFRTETLDALKARWTTCCWFGDDTWRFNDYSSKLAPHFTYVATTDPFSIPKYRKIGVTALLSQWAAQPWPGDLGPLPPTSYDHDVSFVGGYSMMRGWFVERLRRLGVHVECFGHGWPNGAVSFDEMGRIFRRSRINLSLSNSVCHDVRFVFASWPNFKTYLRTPKRAEQIKARNFEIALAGGFQLTSYAPGLEHYLRIGDEIAVFTSPEECALQIGYYLENEAERLRLLNASLARTAAEHTYRHRLSHLLQEISVRQRSA
ncbi:MAG: glycosyltransferase [Elusimicrobia bacterium]|nr:glycosyltransferase [Elusimicrobiota bacterium]